MFKAIVQHFCSVKSRWDNKEKKTNSQALTGSQKGNIFLVTGIHVFSLKEFILEVVMYKLSGYRSFRVIYAINEKEW